VSALQKARFAVFAYFTISGAAVTFWAVHIPFVENKFDISHAAIGALLLVYGGGALTAIQMVGNLIDRVGSRTAAFISGTFMGVMLFLPGLANSPLYLGIALFLLGIGVGATDVAMNAHAVDVEKAYQRPIFSAFHSMWSFGGLIGASIGGIALANGLDMQTTLTGAAIATMFIAISMRTWMLPDNPNHQSAKKIKGADKQAEKARLKKLNASNRKVLGFVGRIFVVRFGSLVSAVGTCVVVLSTTSAVALAGWVIAGIGIAGVVPQIFAYSAEVGEDTHTGRNMAKVVGITYAGVLAGPAIIGFLTALVPLNIAIGLGVVLGLFTALGTVVIEKRNSNAKAL